MITQEAQLPLDTHERIVEAMEQRHRDDVGRMAMKLVRYRIALEEAGIEVPDPEGQELLRMWRDCASVVSTASSFAAQLGSARELLDEPWLQR